jgi:Tol biopolymer transport system component
MHDEPNPDRQDDSFPAGTRVGHYEIVAEIGQGSAGIVYRARDRGMGRDVALKCLRPAFAMDHTTRLRFLREPRAASRLSHPNVVPIFEVFEHAGLPWIAMQFVEGKSLRQILTEKGAQPADDVLHYGVQLADALQAAHEKHVIHRDVSPNNVLVTPERRVMLTDFGIARFYTPPGAISGTHSPPITGEGALLGTLPYISPEQILGRELDGRSDIFSLGAVLYELGTGKVAFPAEEMNRVIDEILHHEPRAISQFTYDIPAELERIIRKALKKDPDERYQTAREMQVDLKALRGSGTGHPYVIRGTPKTPVIDFPRLRRPLIFLAIMLAIAVAGLAAFRKMEALKVPESTPLQLTSAEGWDGEPALSPVGDFLAYSSNESGNTDVWVIHIRTGQQLQLTTHPSPDRSPAWFPDGNAVAFVSRRSGVDGIWKVPLLGGDAVPVLPRAADPAISPDGALLAYSAPDSTGSYRIWVAPLDNLSAARRLTSDGDGLWWHRLPAWSPDGRTLCYTGQQDIWLVPVRGGKARRLTSAGYADVVPFWAPARNHIYFSSYFDGIQALWRVRPGGGGVERLTSGNGTENHPTLSGERTQLAYSTFVEDPDVVIRDREKGTEARIPGAREELTPSLVPDGSGVVFASDRLGKQFDLWLQPLSGGKPDGAPRRLTEHDGNASFPAVSPDGKWVAYYRIYRARETDEENQRDIWAVPVDGGPPVQVTDDARPDVQPTFSPDGSKIVFVSERDGAQRLWTVPFSGRPGPVEAVRLTDSDVVPSVPDWSPDGETIAFVGLKDNESDVWVIAADGRPPARRVTKGANAHEVRFEPGASSLLVSAQWGGDRPGLRHVDPYDGTWSQPDTTVQFGPALYYADFDLSADGRLLAYVQDTYRGDVWILKARRGAW